MKTFGGERGFTLAEVLTALMILGLLAVTAIPAYTELRIRYQVQDQRFEAVQLMQEQMERLQRTWVVPAVNRTMEINRAGTMFRVTVRKRLIRSHLLESEVVIRWRDFRKQEQLLRLRARQFAP
ncbi:prepilin-type N-terminal cleavage/methylation domain-containing protein [Polycladomyces sp. WAk]|uniref:Prepilin-type N-terminal cleavage/methylation domain-containing protein n=1 Tax=Polycladomyces zharkentensis TaxID=2807616 RepID=A0ABS2WG03_9BACL|nr:prepilin-type N-terminal cleavage/methylation domain-containing protein [Polycladomyces sp. WAk]